MTSGEARTVYLLGAGINYEIRRVFHSLERGEYYLRPPLARDLFKVAFQLPRIAAHLDSHRTDLRELYDYIERHWGLTVGDLREEDFDLEKLFSRIQQDQLDARNSGNADEYLLFTRVFYQLRLLLLNLLSEFAYDLTPEMSRLAELIYREQAVVLTFNYDTILESAIERASGEDLPPEYWDEVDVNLYAEERPIPDELVLPAISPYNWKRSLAYGVQFETFRSNLQHMTAPIPANRVYSRADLDQYAHPRFLKLHGSIDWLVRSGYRLQPSGQLTQDGEKAGTVVQDTIVGSMMAYGTLWSPYGSSPGVVTLDDEFMEPLIVPPVEYKDLEDPPIAQLWERAKQELAGCRRLVVGGLSFAPTDRAIRTLLREVFAENALEELVVINPVEEVADTAKELTQFGGTVDRFCGLGEFLEGLGLKHPFRARGRKRCSMSVGSPWGYLPGTGGASPVHAVDLREGTWFERIVMPALDFDEEFLLAYEVSYERVWDGQPERRTITVNVGSSAGEPTEVDVRDSLVDGEVTITCLAGTDEPVRGHISLDYFALSA